MKPRITISLTIDGELEVHLNESGRDLLVKELQHLSEDSDHFHFGPEEAGGEVPTQTYPYRDDHKIVGWGKVLFRPDKWDAQYHPHVLKAK